MRKRTPAIRSLSDANKVLDLISLGLMRVRAHKTQYGPDQIIIVSASGHPDSESLVSPKWAHLFTPHVTQQFEVTTMSKLSQYGDPFELPPEGRYPANVESVFITGTQPGKYGPKVYGEIGYGLSGPLNSSGKPFVVNDRHYNFSLTSSKFRDDFRAITGLENLGDVEPRDILGLACEVQIVHMLSEKGNTFAKILVFPFGGENPPVPASEPRFFSVAPDEFDTLELESMPKRLREMAKASPEYAARMQPSHEQVAGLTEFDDGMPENLGPGQNDLVDVED